MQNFEVSSLHCSLPAESIYTSRLCNKTIMDVKVQSIKESLPESIYPSPIATKKTETKTSIESALINAIVIDDKSKLIEQAKEINSITADDSDVILDRKMMSKLLHLCCELDSVNSAEALLTGELTNGRVVPLTNEIDADSGFAPLHTAAENHSYLCIELLLRKRARTDMKTKKPNKSPTVGVPGNGSGSGNDISTARSLLPLELALYSRRMELDWKPDQPLDDLLLRLSEKDLGAIKVLSEKTKEVGEVAYTFSIEGRVAALAALLMVAAEKVNGSVLEVRTNTDLAAEKMTVYGGVVKEAVSIYIGTRSKQKSVQVSKNGIHDVEEERRKVLLREMELLHFFGASPNNSFGDKKVTSPLIIASQAGDEAVVKLLLQTGIDVSDADVDGNSALHWTLKASKVSSPEHISIMGLLLKHGARVRQKDRLGLTAVHVAAANGNLEALKLLLTHDSDSVHITSVLKETPLFFAAKNDFIECAQLLVSYGAATDIHNLRRERPIDLAKSQDMRSAINRTSIIITNRTSQQKYIARIQNNQVVSETCEALSKEAYSTSESVDSSSEGEICKYYASATGCARGSTCFYRHGEEEQWSLKSKANLARSTVLAEFKRKIFVGGLPPDLDSGSLGDVMEEQFGPVADANVLRMETEDQVVSRGFGFVTFKHEKSVAAALETHHTHIWGKKVEMKSAVPKWLFSLEDREDEPQKEIVQQESMQHQCPTKSQSLGEDIPKKKSWAEHVGKALPDFSVNLRQACRPQNSGQDKPVWFATFKKWLPQFLRKLSKNSGGEYYSLSSLKTDFKSIFGLDLDHASLGYSKLSDFVRSLSDLCRVKIIHTGGQVPNHMILLPVVPRPPPLVVPKKIASVSRTAAPVPVGVDDATDCRSAGMMKGATESDIHSDKTSETKIDANSSVNELYGKTTNPTLNAMPPIDYSRFLQFLNPDPIFLARTWLGTGGYKFQDEQCRRKHLVLEALSRKRKQVFFLRGPNFYKDYATKLQQGICFACEKQQLLWANYPCQHMLWCGDCKLVAMKIAAVGTSTHKCVICDEVVERINLIPWTKRQLQKYDDIEFPSFYTASMRSQGIQA
ncbi:unnamed protein product [Amaranthus hypochondriacus]